MIRHTVMICAVAGMTVGFAIAADAQQIGRDGVVEGARAKAGVAPAAATGSCSPKKIKYKTTEVSVNMSASTFAVVPQTSIAFNQGGAGPSCVIVRYSAMASASPPRWIQMRVVMDGAAIAEPGDIQFEGYTENISLARSFDFIFPAVDPGPHSLAVYWRSFNAGIVFMHRRTTLVHYR